MTFMTADQVQKGDEVQLDEGEWLKVTKVETVKPECLAEVMLHFGEEKRQKFCYHKNLMVRRK